MFTKLRQRLTFANVVSVIALFIALGGSSIAVVTLERNSVRSKHIRNGHVKNRDLGANAVTGPKVKNASLLSEDFAPGQLPRGEKGETGPAGAAGPAGADGTVRAYAQVRPDGGSPASEPSLVTEKTKNVTGVRRMSTGTYCVRVAPGISTTAPPIVTVDYRFSSGPEGNSLAMWDSNSSCDPDEYEVVTDRQPIDGDGDSGAAQEANDVAFDIFVP